MQRAAIYLCLLLFLLGAFSRCAQIVAPTGGPKDTIAPRLTATVPPDSSLHFTAKKISLTFDEYVQLQNLQEQMIVTPYPKHQPVVTSKLQNIAISIKDTLQPNTTYTINLGSAVQDINEGNPAEDFQYVFSTGDYLDSLQISGRLFDAATGKTDSNVVVMLYTRTDDDSVVLREKPVYYTRSKSGGRFRLRNLPHGTYRVFALKDANNDLQYNDSTEAIAFLNDSLRLDHSDSLDLYLFKEKEAVPAPDTSEAAKKDTLTYSVALDEGKQELHNPLYIRFSRPLQQYDSSGVTLLEDTLLRPVTPVFSLDDSTHKTLSVDWKWKEEMPYRLLLKAGFATDTGGLKPPKADTLSFTTKGASDYGSLILHFTHADTAHPYVLQLVQEDKVVKAAPLTGKDWKMENLKPGSYNVRVLEDDNRNGVWDRGRYYGEKKQPERVIPLQPDFNVRANWDNDFPGLLWITDPQPADSTAAGTDSTAAGR
ncbi:Ig-like domain-containing protein [Compostibacter hankyongensis]|uniref:SbsA Ig-like domain-containing protein n=1 Tax=Compostibacter hankyongensis TaxID=1007089 RepID=A0ABP8G5N2_9BACT